MSHGQEKTEEGGGGGGGERGGGRGRGRGGEGEGRRGGGGGGGGGGGCLGMAASLSSLHADVPRLASERGGTTAILVMIVGCLPSLCYNPRFSPSLSR